MVAYNFIKQFADDVAAGRKNFTIRERRKRHARKGENVQVYTGMRTKSCRKLVDPDPVCERVAPIIIWRINQHRCTIALDGNLLTRDQVDYLVTTDGFKSDKEFMAFHLGDLQ